MHPQLQSLVRFFYTQNPFYLISATLVLCGLQLAFRGETADNAWLLAIALAGFTLVLALTAYLVVRFGKVWQDARSLALLVIFMFVAISVSFDGICNTAPGTAATLLFCGLVFSLIVAEVLISVLQIRFPLSYRLPFHSMLALFFLYPLWVSPHLTNQLDEVIAWRVFLFPMAAGLIALCLIPAIRRGSKLLLKNGTPWNWPWYPWSIFVFLAIGVCGRSYVLTLTFQAAMEWPASALVQPPTDWASTFGLYYLTPFFLAILLLLAEIAIVEQSARLRRAVLWVAPFLLLTAVPLGSGKPFDDFLELVVSRVGSPIWLTAIGLAGLYGYVWSRGVAAAEAGACAMLVSLTFISPQTIGAESLDMVHGWPILVLGAWQSQRAFHTKSSVHCVAAAAAFLLAASIQFSGTWFTTHGGLLPWHLLLAVSLAAGLFFTDRFARLLNRCSWLFVIGLGLGALLAGPHLSDSPLLILWYLIGLTSVAITLWLITNRRSWQAAAFMNSVSLLMLAATWLHSGLQTRVPVRALTMLTWGLTCFGLAVLISGLKGGLANFTRRWWQRHQKSLLNEWWE